MDANIGQITSSEEYDEFLQSAERGVIYFRASWAEPCAQMDVVVRTLVNVHRDTGLTFRSVDVDSSSWASSRLDVLHVPTFILVATGLIVDRIEGAHAAQLTKRCSALVSMSQDEVLEAACTAAMSSAPVVVFIKGTPDAPKCGFSRQMVTLLREAGLVFKHVDILKDQDIRERIKKLVNWPTFPQLVAHGQLIGGLDIARELADAGSLVREIKSLEGAPDGETTDGKDEKEGTAAKDGEGNAGTGLANKNDQMASGTPVESVNDAVAVGVNGVSAELNTRLHALVRRKPLMLFMKGSPDAPRCGFSRTIVSLLADNGVKEYGHFDILTDNSVRQGMKKFSQWPTFPQLYAKGELIGGLDIVKELAAGGALMQELGIDGQKQEADVEESLDDRLSRLVCQKPIMVFMKGAPGAPRCGFSREIVALLQEQGVEFGHFDILQDDEVRQGLKTFSKWPTYPQIYANGELVGGLDIAKELVSSGALKTELGLE